MKRKEPRWVVPFLRALERTGEVRTAAEDAGIDHTTAYARRKAHADFAAGWAEALARHRAERERAEEEEIAALSNVGGRAPPPHSVRSPSPSELGEDLVPSGGKVRRVARERWGKRKEAIFFEELAATANVQRAAAAAGVSPTAVHARRLRHPLFRAKWEAVVRTAKASIDLHLVEEAKKTFDPQTLDTADVKPRVTIDQAIRISQLGGSKKEEPAADPFDDPSYNYQDDMADIRERLVRKLQALRRRARPGLLAKGWSYDESWDREIPPGWVKGPDWRPMEPGEDY